MTNATTFQSKIQSFTDLITWKEGHILVIKIYKITQQFPQSEIFGLTNQLRRAAVSVTSNIAEGFTRNSQKEKRRFYNTALASLAEIQNQILITRDVQYITDEDFKKIAHQTIYVRKLLSGLNKTAMNNKNILNTQYHIPVCLLT